jgi:hypothetical protein
MDEFLLCMYMPACMNLELTGLVAWPRVSQRITYTGVTALA